MKNPARLTSRKGRAIKNRRRGTYTVTIWAGTDTTIFYEQVSYKDARDLLGRTVVAS